MCGARKATKNSMDLKLSLLHKSSCPAVIQGLIVCSISPMLLTVCPLNPFLVLLYPSLDSGQLTSTTYSTQVFCISWGWPVLWLEVRGWEEKEARVFLHYSFPALVGFWQSPITKLLQAALHFFSSSRTFSLEKVMAPLNLATPWDSPVVYWLRLCFHCRGYEFDPWSGN